MTQDTRAELGSTLSSILDGATIDDLEPLTAGASRETWRFTAAGAALGPESTTLILQRTRPGAGFDGPSMRSEDRLLSDAFAGGVPVPRIIADSVACSALGDARITEAVNGEALGPRIARAVRTDEERASLITQLGEALAAIHGLDPALHPGLTHADPVSSIALGLAELGEERPAFELALRHLTDTLPFDTQYFDTTFVDSSPRIVHGDFRVGNLLIDGSNLTGVLDWELAHLGDPIEDLGWLCVRAWRFGAPHEVGGIGDAEQLLAAYGAASGREVDRGALDWWIIAGTLRWAMICAVQARRHLDGHVRSVELATIGRRIVESEYDLLNLLGVPDPGKPADPLGSSTSHGKPSAEQLIDAVREHLRDHVAPQLDTASAFSLRVVDRALSTVQREIERSTFMPSIDDESALAASIRSGADIHDALRNKVRRSVNERLAVSNPAWFEQH